MFDVQSFKIELKLLQILIHSYKDTKKYMVHKYHYFSKYIHKYAKFSEH